MGWVRRCRVEGVDIDIIEDRCCLKAFWWSLGGGGDNGVGVGRGGGGHRYI